ncbi:MAG: phospho-N-acetylmuramoyl-pentapeptide-transferase [Chloroflexi bacterium]|nr:phospho-N-acetylmuramoyl-pentapeptide-transferase [Chloroflexota bacterium]
MAEALLWGTISSLITVALGGPCVRLLKRYQIGKRIRIEGPQSHQVKMGTPTMGGLLMVVPVLVITLLSNVIGRYSILLPLGIMVAYAVLGAVDDWIGVKGPTGMGLLARIKFPLQIAIGAIAAIGLQYFLEIGLTAVPTFPRPFDLGIWYIPAAVFVIVSTANAVNLTDGLDGLAGGVAAIAFIAYGIIAYLQGQAYLVTFCFTIVGAILAFLWYNAYPAQLFMGDIGSEALGAALATVALMTGQWLLLPIVGLVFVAEAGSVLIQVAYFKLTKGKRIFRMTPLHHHFELLGWSEVQVTQRFWLVSLWAAMLGIALALT